MIKERNTKQKELVINILRKNKDKHLTAEEILILIKKESDNISQATVYRILGQLVSGNVIRKYIASGSKKACYQYVDNVDKCNMHYHLICDKCGKTFHFENNQIEDLKSNISKENNFEVNLEKVVFYGTCKNCK